MGFGDFGSRGGSGNTNTARRGSISLNGGIGAQPAIGEGGSVLSNPDPDAPPWETPTWADSKAFDGLYKRGEVPMNAARSAFQNGMISRSEMEYILSGFGPEQERSRFEKIMGYHDHRGGFWGNVENFAGFLGTVSGYRFFVSASAAVLQGLKDTGGQTGLGKFDGTDSFGVSVGGFGLAWNTEEFKRAWHGRTYYSEVFAKGGLDPGDGIMSAGFARGLAADILLDPATWLTFGISAYGKATVRTGSKASQILGRNVGSKAVSFGGKATEVAGNLTLSRYGEDIMKIAGRHLIGQNNMSRVVRRSSFESAKKSVKAGRLKDALWDFHYAKNRTDEIVGFVDEIYDEFGVSASTISPEHVTRMMERPDFAARFTEWTVENFELFATEHLDLMRGGMADGVFSQAQRVVKGDMWTPKGLASRANLRRGPRSMFEETAGILGKEIGIPVDNMLGSAARALRDVDTWAADALSREAVSGPLAAATKVTGWTSGRAGGAIERIRNFFTSSIERLPFEDRIGIQATFDGATAEMTRTATRIREVFDTPINYTDAMGRKISRKITLDERKLITKHLEQPSVHQLPDHLSAAADWVREQFDDLWRKENALGISGEKLDDYVTHIYGSKTRGRMMMMMAKLNLPPPKLEARMVSMTAPIRNPYALHRQIATLEDAAEWFGEAAVEFDIANILHKRASMSARMRAKQAARYQMVSKYGIGGIASTMLMEQAGFSKLLRAAGYVRNYVDPTGVNPIRPSQVQKLDQLMMEVAKMDLSRMGKLGQSVRRPIPKGLRSVDDEAGNLMTAKKVIKDEGGNFAQVEYQAAGSGIIKTGERPWFQPIPDKDARKALTGKRYKKRVAANRRQLSRLTKSVFGKKVSDLTTGEADFLFDFIQGFINPQLLTDRRGAFARPGWRAKDAMVLVNIESGLIRRGKLAFGVQEGAEGLMRLVPKAADDIVTADLERSARAILKRRGVKPAGQKAIPETRGMPKGASAGLRYVDDYSPEQIQGVIKELGERRARSGLGIGDLERAGLKGRIDDLLGQAEGLGKEAFRLRREAGTGVNRAAAKAGRLVESLKGKIKGLGDETNKINRAEARKLRSIDRGIIDAQSKLARTQERIAKKQAALERLGPKAVKTREKLTAAIERAKELAKKQQTRKQRLEKLSEEASEGFNKTREELLKRYREYKDALVQAEAEVARTTSAKAKLKRSKELEELRTGKTAQAKELTSLLGQRTAQFDRHLQDINGQYLLPRSFVDTINETLDSGFDFTQQHHRFLRAWQDFQKIWKVPLTLPFAEHHFRNALTNVGLMATGLGLRMLNPKIWMSAANVSGYLLFKTGEASFAHGKRLLPEAARKAFERAAKKTRDDWEKATVTTVDGVEYTVREIAEQALTRGVNHGFVHAELGFTPFQTFDQGASGVITPALRHTWDLTKGSLQKTMVAAENVFDVPFRMAMFTDAVIQGKTFDEAAEVVRQGLNDWSRLGKKEKVYMRTVMPFYSWTQFSLERAFKDAISTPGRFVAPIKGVQNATAILNDSNPPPNYQPNFISSRLGIWSAPNEHGYYQKLVGFGLNQEEALRQMSAFADFARVFVHEGLKIMSPELAYKAVPPPRAGEAGLRVLAQMDFISKSVIEAIRGRQFFDDSPTGTRSELLMLERSRLERGRGFEILDQGIAENKEAAGVVGAVVSGVGGKWLKEWLEYRDATGPGGPKVSAYKRWLLGQTPVSRFVSVYEQRVKQHKPGEVNYKVAALHTLGMSIYKYHPQESRYYRDRARISAVARAMRQAHMIDSGSIYWDTGLGGEADDPVTKGALEQLRKQIQANPRR